MPKLVDNKYLPFFIDNGVPHSVLMANFAVNYTKFLMRINIELNDKPVTYAIDKQQNMLDKMLTSKKNYLAVLSGQHNDNIAAQAALFMCLRSVENATHKPFHWHSITGNTYDKIRDDDIQHSLVSQSKLLVISNIAPNSTNMKLEKLRDLVEMYSHLPRIIVVAGTDPLSFCFKQLYVKPSILGYFGKNGEQDNEED